MWLILEMLSSYVQTNMTFAFTQNNHQLNWFYTFPYLFIIAESSFYICLCSLGFLHGELFIFRSGSSLHCDEEEERKLDNCTGQVCSWVADEHGLHPRMYQVLKMTALEYIILIVKDLLPKLRGFQSILKQGWEGRGKDLPNGDKAQTYNILLPYSLALWWACAIMETRVIMEISQCRQPVSLTG